MGRPPVHLAAASLPSSLPFHSAEAALTSSPTFHSAAAPLPWAVLLLAAVLPAAVLRLAQVQRQKERVARWQQ